MRHFMPFFRTSSIYIRQTEVDDVVSGKAVEYVGTDIPASFSESQLNSGRIIRLFVPPDRFCALLCYI